MALGIEDMNEADEGLLNFGYKSKLMKVLAILPVIFVWCLPWISTVHWLGHGEHKPDLYGLRFGNRCKHSPYCALSLCGLSVSEYIATPMATGTMATVFFPPMVQLWSMKSEIQDVVPHGMLNLLILLVFWNLFFMMPVTEAPGLHALAVGLFSLSGLRLFYGMWMNGTVREGRLLSIFLFVSCLAFGGVFVMCVLAKAAAWFGGVSVFKKHVPVAFYICEGCGLTCMSLFPWFWHSTMDGFVHRPGMLKHRHTLREVNRMSRTSALTLRTMSVLPCIYVWCCPLLTEFCHRCEGYPHCEERIWVSTFLSATSPTGAFTAVFFWPLAHLWAHKHEFANTCRRRAALANFYVAFAAYTVFNTRIYPKTHAVAAAWFAVSALTVYVQVLDQKPPGIKKCVARLLLAIAFLAVISIGLLLMCAFSTEKVRIWQADLLQRQPLMFYILEATALTCMAVFPWFWESPSGSRRSHMRQQLEEFQLAEGHGAAGIVGGCESLRSGGTGYQAEKDNGAAGGTPSDEDAA